MKANKTWHFVCGVLVTYGLVVTYGNMDSDLDDDLKILNNVITVRV